MPSINAAFVLLFLKIRQVPFPDDDDTVICYLFKKLLKHVFPLIEFQK